MILTDREIRAAIAAKRIIISPDPEGGSFSATTVDLRLSPRIQEWVVDPPPPTVCPGRPGFLIQDELAKLTRTIDIGNSYQIKPRQFLLAWTLERIELPKESMIAARVEGKSSLARLGLGVHITAPTVHPGFSGPLQLEVYNHGPAAIELVVGMRVCQLIFETTLGTPDQAHGGQFKGQKPS
jgi:dCTP deaminase